MNSHKVSWDDTRRREDGEMQSRENTMRSRRKNLTHFHHFCRPALTSTAQTILKGKYNTGNQGVVLKSSSVLTCCCLSPSLKSNSSTPFPLYSPFRCLELTYKSHCLPTNMQTTVACLFLSCCNNIFLLKILESQASVSK